MRREKCLGCVWGDIWSGAQITIDYVHGPLADTLQRFTGNQSQAQADRFKIVLQDGKALFVGGT